MNILFKQTVGIYHKGHEANLPDDIARRLVGIGAAVVPGAKDAVAPTTISKTEAYPTGKGISRAVRKGV